MDPFLKQFATSAESPPESDLMKEYYFDEEDDLLHKKSHPDQPPAVELPGELGPKTKKKHRENRDD